MGERKEEGRTGTEEEGRRGGAGRRAGGKEVWDFWVCVFRVEGLRTRIEGLGVDPEFVTASCSGSKV
eukprot:3721898-Rhodomonas_salina.1